jgi:hypothetical protein
MMEKTEEYTFTLKTDKLASYSRVSAIFFALNIFSLFFFAFITANELQRTYALVGGGIISLWLVFVLVRKDTQNNRMRFTPGYVFLLFLWFQMLHLYWAAAIVLLLGALDYIARRPLLVRFTSSHVHYPSFPARTIPWDAVQHVVLKDGLLTIDFANNKLLQAEVEDDLLTGEEALFNAFAAKRMEGVDN